MNIQINDIVYFPNALDDTKVLQCRDIEYDLKGYVIYSFGINKVTLRFVYDLREDKFKEERLNKYIVYKLDDKNELMLKDWNLD